MISSFALKLIQNSSGIKKYVATEMQMTAHQFESTISNILQQENSIGGETEVFSKKVNKILTRKKIDRSIIIKGFPKNWEDVLRFSYTQVAMGFRHNEFLLKKGEEIIQALKNGEKFHIENNAGAIKLFKILENNYGIVFKYIHGFGFTLDFKNLDKASESVKEFPFEAFSTALKITNSDTTPNDDVKTSLFYEFISNIVLEKKDEHVFSVKELHEFYLKNGLNIEENHVFNYIRKITLRGAPVGIILKNGKNGQLKYTFEFKVVKFGNYVKKYFPTDTKEFERKIDDLFKNYKNKSFLELLKQALLEKNMQPIFFKSREFLEKNGQELVGRVTIALKTCKEAKLLGIKGKDSYYIIPSCVSQNSNFEHIIENFKISGGVSKIHINALNYILGDMNHFIDIETLNENDIHIKIENECKSIAIIINNQILIDHINEITFVADEVGDKLGYIISIKTQD